MSTAIQPSLSSRVRALKARHAYLAPEDIAKLAHIDLKLVKAALGGDVRQRIKSVAP